MDSQLSDDCNMTKNDNPASTRNQAPHPGRRTALWVLVATLSLIIVAGTAVVLCSLGHSGPEKRLYIAASSTRGQLRDSLTSALGHDEGRRVYALWRAIGGQPGAAHGSYLITPGQTTLSVARALKSGRQTPVKVRFNGGRSVEDAARAITSTLECEPDSFVRAWSEALTERGFEPRQMMAALMPDTYEAFWTDSPRCVAERLLRQYDRFWSRERLDKAAAIGLTPVEVATLASIVEGETAKSDERPTVARLYLNRLAKGMRLQSDPTVKFATGNPRLRRITARHLKTESPYNTYLHEGLPPGPISIVSASTLDAVLNAPHNDYIYMCAREDFSGYHNFARDFATHSANATRYRRELDRRGIK